MDEIIKILHDSGVILTPTDTTFGLSCVASSREACKRINIIKKRPENKHFILLAESDAHLQRLVEVPDMAWDIMDFSEKPVTIIYDKLINIPPHLVSPEGTIGIRVVKHPDIQRIIQRLRQPLISTSANISGKPTPTRFAEISPEILEQVDYIMPEAKEFVPPTDGSTIIQLSSDGRVKVIRV